MGTLRTAFIALFLLGACSDGQSIDEAKEEEGQIGASSGPNPNFDGAAAGDAFGSPTPPEQPDSQTAPSEDAPAAPESPG